jgi:hypothetical protein
MDNRTSAAGLPHSEIPRSTPGYRLPWAYRRFPRPSSPSDAKTSTTCPCWLDHVDLGPTNSPAAATSPVGQRYKPDNPACADHEKRGRHRRGKPLRTLLFFSMNHDKKSKIHYISTCQRSSSCREPPKAATCSSAVQPTRTTVAGQGCAHRRRAQQYSPSSVAVKRAEPPVAPEARIEHLCCGGRPAECPDRSPSRDRYSILTRFPCRSNRLRSPPQSHLRPCVATRFYSPGQAIGRWCGCGKHR